MMKLQPSIHYSVKWMSNRRLLLLTGIISFSFGLFIVIGAIKDSRADVHFSMPMCNVSQSRDLLLFSYMRSGSSLTAELIRDSPNTFFVFEPLIPLAPYHYFTDESVCNMRDVKCSKEKASPRIREALSTVKNIFSCNIKAVPQTVIKEILKQNKSGHAWNKYGKCLNESSNNKGHTGRCLLEIEKDCREAETRVSKILRLSFTNVDEILQDFPKLNVLLLFRDPRAIINSRIKTDWFPVDEDEPDTVANNIKSLCEKIKKDFNIYERIERKFSTCKRILKRTVENITGNAEGMHGIFKFINKNATTQDRDKIDRILSLSKRKYLFRDWTNELRAEYKIQIEEECGCVLHEVTSVVERCRDQVFVSFSSKRSMETMDMVKQIQICPH